MNSQYIFILIDDITLTGGTERVATFLANGLTEAGKKVKIVSLNSKNKSPGYKLSEKIDVVYINSLSVIKLGYFLKVNPCQKIVSISMGRLSFKAAMLHKALRLKAELILSEHVSYERSNTLVRLLKRLSYRFADHLVLLTEHDFNFLNSKLSTQCSVIINASNYPIANESILDVKNKTVLAVGRLTYQKDFQRLLDIWSSIDNLMGWKLRIVGDGEDRVSLQKTIDRYQIGNSVTLVPATNQIEKEYALASILVMTSRFEGLPLAVIEAKSFALPAISFDCPTGPKELISDNVDGFLIPVNDNELFKSRLLKLMTGPDTLNRMQLASLSNADTYSKGSVINKWLDLLDG